MREGGGLRISRLVVHMSSVQTSGVINVRKRSPMSECWVIPRGTKKNVLIERNREGKEIENEKERCRAH